MGGKWACEDMRNVGINMVLNHVICRRNVGIKDGNLWKSLTLTVLKKKAEKLETEGYFGILCNMWSKFEQCGQSLTSFAKKVTLQSNPQVFF